MDISPTTAEEVISVIKNLPNRKAPGIDGINNSALKNLPFNYAHHLAKLINSAFKFMYFPAIWRDAVIIPIKKSVVDPSIARNYRPVSLLLAISKLTEHIFLSRLVTFLPDIPEQFGFRPKHSTSHQLLRVVECIMDAFNNSEQVAIVNNVLYNPVRHTILKQRIQRRCHLKNYAFKPHTLCFKV